ncbi:hypothetical protein V5D56_16905 [Cellulosimicrobium sp. PMB13]|uniref:AMIN-like domain-containing (lipo)protein n=1 Tax=Cellulosimicrobium sp. PMB13 TaxID=3120158 RepID=UPI003F4B50C7
MTTRRAGTARFTPTAATATVLALTLAACSTGGGTDDDPPPSATATSEAPSPTETSEPPAETATDDPTAPADESSDAPVPFPANTEPDVQEPTADALLTVTDIRVGHHDGYDRAVLELGGTGTPGWRVEYVDRPVGDGKGDVVEVDGDAFLQVMISGSGYPMDTGVEEHSEPNPVEGGDDGVIEEVRLLGVFEGYTQAFVGVDGEQRPFRVFALENPTRVVVDVRDDG